MRIGVTKGGHPTGEKIPLEREEKGGSPQGGGTLVGPQMDGWVV